MKEILKIFFTLAAVLVSTMSWAQDTATSSDFMESVGKIYVVVGVLLIIFVGIILYMVRLEVKLNKLEKSQKQEDSW